MHCLLAELLLGGRPLPVGRDRADHALNPLELNLGVCPLLLVEGALRAPQLLVVLVVVLGGVERGPGVRGLPGLGQDDGGLLRLEGRAHVLGGAALVDAALELRAGWQVELQRRHGRGASGAVARPVARPARHELGRCVPGAESADLLEAPEVGRRGQVGELRVKVRLVCV